MKNMEEIQKLSVLHCVYQEIASADGSIVEERDLAAINYALSELDLSSLYSWDMALQMNPHDCFSHASGLCDNDKKLVRNMLLKVTQMGGNTDSRMICAKHILQFAKC